MNSRLTFKVLLILLVAVSFVGLALADDDKGDKVKKMDGKELFKSHCKVCHMEDSDAGEYTPMSLIMDQWDEFFDETFTETHKAVPCPQDEGKMVTDKFDKDMIKKLRKFCVDHAADSEQPMTCG
jgi:hypothetical protein